jgi:hypothetical protein
MNLFTGDLGQVSLADLENFLGMKAPMEQRPAEGVRIDYKQKPPADYPETVAAFANGFGGLLFLGVESNRKKFNYPLSLPGADFPGGDVRAQITGKILAQVVPRPEVAIGVVPIPPQPDKAVVVIRVGPGVWPPYQFQSGDDVRIPIRVQDTNRQATVRDIEQLFERRTSFAQSGLERLTAIESSSPVAPEFAESEAPNGPQVEISRAYHVWTIAPRLVIRLRLDSVFDRTVRADLAKHFKDSPIGNFYPPRMAADFHVVRWQARITDQACTALTYARNFRFTSDGGLRYAEKIDRHKTKQESVSDLFIDSSRFHRFAADFYTSRDFFGGFSISHRVDCLDPIKFYANFPDSNGSYHQTNAIVFAGAGVGTAQGSSRMSAELVSLDRDETHRTLLDFMLGHLRQLAQANVDYAALEKVIANLPDRNSVPFF